MHSLSSIWHELHDRVRDFYQVQKWWCPKWEWGMRRLSGPGSLLNGRITRTRDVVESRLADVGTKREIEQNHDSKNHLLRCMGAV